MYPASLSILCVCLKVALALLIISWVYVIQDSSTQGPHREDISNTLLDHWCRTTDPHILLSAVTLEETTLKQRQTGSWQPLISCLEGENKWTNAYIQDSNFGRTQAVGLGGIRV